MSNHQKITDSPIDFAEQVIDDVKNSKEDGVLKCVQCGMCTSTCPAARHSEHYGKSLGRRLDNPGRGLDMELFLLLYMP